MEVKLINTPEERHRATTPDARTTTTTAKPAEDDCSDLRVTSLDHSAIWDKYNAKAGQIQHVVPTPGE